MTNKEFRYIEKTIRHLKEAWENKSMSLMYEQCGTGELDYQKGILVGSSHAYRDCAETLETLIGSIKFYKDNKELYKGES